MRSYDEPPYRVYGIPDLEAQLNRRGYIDGCALGSDLLTSGWDHIAYQPSPAQQQRLERSQEKERQRQERSIQRQAAREARRAEKAAQQKIVNAQRRQRRRIEKLEQRLAFLKRENEYLTAMFEARREHAKTDLLSQRLTAGTEWL